MKNIKLIATLTVLFVSFANQIAKAEPTPSCEIHVSKKVLPEDEVIKDKYKKLFEMKGYKVISEDKKDAYLLDEGLIPGCFIGTIMGYSCSMLISLDYYKGDYANSGLKIQNPYNKTHTVATLDYETYSLFSKPTYEDMLIDLLKNKLISCQEAEAKKNKKAHADDDFDTFITDLNALDAVCEKNGSIDDSAYNYYYPQYEKIKDIKEPKDIKDRERFANNLRLKYLFEHCTTLINKTKASQSINDNSRSSKPFTADQGAETKSTSSSTVSK